MRTLKHTVAAPQDGMRLDLFLAGALPELSRRKVRTIIDIGGAYVNDKRVRVASRTVHHGDRVRIEFSEAALTSRKAVSTSLTADDILADRSGVIAINKPPGLPSQATKDQSVLHVLPCLEKILKEKGGKKRKLVLVHRLDKETSGILLIADGNERATWLTDQFRDRSVEKIYWAICHGIPKADEFAESAPLTPIDQRTGDVRAVRSGGKPAVTEFRTLAVNKELGLSLIECRPKTGRSHQLRVHLDINGLPIVGDKRYGGAHAKKPLPPALAELTQAHHMLHAARLSFQPAPDAARVTLNAAPPERFRKLLEAAALHPNVSSGNV